MRVTPFFSSDRSFGGAGAFGPAREDTINVK
jgi:hypothetical protein